MIDIKILRNEPERIKESMARRGDTNVDVDALHKLDQDYLALIQTTESQRAEINRLKPLCREDMSAREQMGQIKADLKANEEKQKEEKINNKEQQ